MGKDTLINLASLLLSKKKHLLCKLKLFSQNTDVLRFPDDFCIYQRTVDEYINFQTLCSISSAVDINVVNAHCGGFYRISVALVIFYLHVQQKQLSSHIKTYGTGGVDRG